MRKGTSILYISEHRYLLVVVFFNLLFFLTKNKNKTDTTVLNNSEIVSLNHRKLTATITITITIWTLLGVEGYITLSLKLSTDKKEIKHLTCQERDTNAHLKLILTHCSMHDAS